MIKGIAGFVLKAISLGTPALRRRVRSVPTPLADRDDRPPASSPDDCPSADDLRLIRRFEKGGSGSSGLEFKRPAADAASGGLRWLYA